MSAPMETSAVVGRLTPQEVELWRLVARGLHNAEIARHVYVSERTARRMVASLVRRLGVANRVQAAALAGRAGLVRSPWIDTSPVNVNR
jgi:two-component system, NarL family, nitrate/nitrite response regulator NarL